MSNFGDTQQASTTLPFFATSNLPAAAFHGVRSRRIMAFCLDFILVTILAAMLSVGLFFVTLGLSVFILPSLWPFVAFFYNGTTITGPRMATPGMRLLDLEMRTPDGAPVGFIAAGLHAVLLYASWLFPPVFLASLVTQDKRCLHDIVAGVLVVRRPS